MQEPVSEDVVDEPIFANAEQADQLLTDEEAEARIEIVDHPGSHSTGKMAFVNLDTLCEAYENGAKVTLDDLKAKKLVPPNTKRVKILARGVMTKQLDIVADKFSIQAVKMISLAGGRVEQNN